MSSYRSVDGYSNGAEDETVEDIARVNRGSWITRKSAASSMSALAAPSRSTMSRSPRSTPAAAMKDWLPLTLDEMVAQGILEYTPFPEALKGIRATPRPI